MPPRRPTSRPLALALALSLAGCGMQLPSPSLIIHRRPLAIRVEVTGSLLPEDPALAPRAQGLPFEEVTITPLVVDVDGPVDPDALDAVWFACPLRPTGGTFDCISERFPTDPDALPECAPPPPMAALDFEDLPEAQELCVLSREGSPTLTIPLDRNILSGGRIELTLVAGSPDGPDTQRCTEQLFAGDQGLDTGCVVASQIVSVGPLEQLFLLAEQLGFDLPAEFEAPPEEEIPDFDRHPRIDFFEASVVPESLSTERERRTPIDAGDSYPAALGSRLRFDTSTPAEDLQTFFIRGAEGDLREQSEALQARWFIDWGRLLSGQSNDLSSFNELELRASSRDELERPAGDRVHLYYVLRDGRAGVSWTWMTIDIEP